MTDPMTNREKAIVTVGFVLLGEAAETDREPFSDLGAVAARVVDALAAIPPEIDAEAVNRALRAWWEDRSPGNDPRPAMRAALEAALTREETG